MKPYSSGFHENGGAEVVVAERPSGTSAISSLPTGLRNCEDKSGIFYLLAQLGSWAAATAAGCKGRV
jgi:hypothetical protein